MFAPAGGHGCGNRARKSRSSVLLPRVYRSSDVVSGDDAKNFQKLPRVACGPRKDLLCTSENRRSQTFLPPPPSEQTGSWHDFIADRETLRARARARVPPTWRNSMRYFRSTAKIISLRGSGPRKFPSDKQHRPSSPRYCWPRARTTRGREEVLARRVRVSFMRYRARARAGIYEPTL